MIDVFQQELGRVLDEHAPMITKRLPIRQPKPWFSEDIKEQNRKYIEEREYGEGIGKIISGWLSKVKNENTEKFLKRPK